MPFFKELFSGEARDILLRQSRLAQFCSDLAAKALILVTPTELEIFYSDLAAKALLLVPPSEIEIFYQYLSAKALLWVPHTHLEIFYRDLTAKALLLSNSTRIILPTLYTKALLLVPTLLDDKVDDKATIISKICHF